jgi:hypothetical protein
MTPILPYLEPARPSHMSKPTTANHFLRPLLRVLAPVLAIPLAWGSCWADGGVIIARETVNDLNLTVFASPVPLRAGPADISVLVQDTKGQAVLDASVEIGWTATAATATTDWLPPCCSMNTLQGLTPALRTHSQNKLLYGVLLPIRSAGASEISVRVTSPRGDARLDIPVTIAPPRAPVLTYWPLLAFPPVAIGLFAVHQRLSRRSFSKPAGSPFDQD